MSEETSTEKLERIRDHFGLNSIHEARRWLREAVDLGNRHKITKGLPQAIDSMGESYVEDGVLQVRRQRSKVKVANESRLFIDDVGLTRTDVSLEPEIVPELVEAAPISPFQRGLQAVESGRAHATGGKLKPRKLKTEKQKKEKKPKVKKEIQRKPKRKKVKRKPKPRQKQTVPREGSISRDIYERLVCRRWNYKLVRDEMVAEGKFDRYPAEKRPQLAIASILTVVERYGPPGSRPREKRLDRSQDRV